jgi:predicted methyltransferase
MSSLTRIVPWSQQLVCEVLKPGDLAVDLTAGKGRDTLALAKAVGPRGQVFAFDLQDSALQQALSLLQENDVAASLFLEMRPLDKEYGVYLVHSCHSRLKEVVQRPAKAIMANLGYLPGGDQSLVTKPESTLSALHQSLAILAPGGRLAVTVYPAHPGGAEEASVVDAFFESLPRDQWQVLLLRAANRSEAPYLLVAEQA